MATTFQQRVFGCAIIKSLNSNYNADFSHRPRTLPNGTVYATDKVLKYSVRNYMRQAMKEKIFYQKSFTEDMSPRTLDETYEFHFGKMPEDKDKKKLRLTILKNILSVVDVRLFGGTYAGKTNISIHGTTQFTHGINRFGENVIYSEQIMSPFRNSGDGKEDSTMTTLGTQAKLQEGHYVHHFSINPQNIAEDAARVGQAGLLVEDVEKLKEALRRGVTYYDSSAKAGTENELLLWVQLKADAKLVLPSFVEMVDVREDRTIDLGRISELLGKAEVAKDIERIELYYQQNLTKVAHAPEGCIVADL